MGFYFLMCETHTESGFDPVTYDFPNIRCHAILFTGNIWSANNSHDNTLELTKLPNAVT